jgi:hypothetical protein
VVLLILALLLTFPPVADLFCAGIEGVGVAREQRRELYEEMRGGGEVR